MTERKIVQIACSSCYSEQRDGMGQPPIVDTVYALCSDGTLWYLKGTLWYLKDDDDWTRLPAVPAAW
jgi:hypothetical protein